MSGLQAIRRSSCHWLNSLPFLAVLGLILGGLISTAAIPQPNIAVITISSPIIRQTFIDDILDAIKRTRDTASIKAVVLRIDSPGGEVSGIEEIYLDLLRLRQYKPVVASIGTVAASGGYYIAAASNFIYAEPASQIGNVGAFVKMPEAQKLDENIGTSGPFKESGGSKRKYLEAVEMIKQTFLEAVKTQRGERLKLSDAQLSRGEIYLGIESLRYGLIDDIGTRTTALEKAASLAGIRNYGVIQMRITSQPLLFFLWSSDLEALKSQGNLVPIYYYLYFETR